MIKKGDILICTKPLRVANIPGQRPVFTIDKEYLILEDTPHIRVMDDDGMSHYLNKWDNFFKAKIK